MNEWKSNGHQRRLLKITTENIPLVYSFNVYIRSENTLTWARYSGWTVLACCLSPLRCSKCHHHPILCLSLSSFIFLARNCRKLEYCSALPWKQTASVSAFSAIWCQLGWLFDPHSMRSLVMVMLFVLLYALPSTSHIWFFLIAVLFSFMHIDCWFHRHVLQY